MCDPAYWQEAIVTPSRLRRFLIAPLSDKMAILVHSYWVLKGRLYYRFIFKRFGHKTVIRRPMFILNGDCIEIGDQVSIWDGVRLQVVRDRPGRIPLLTIGSNTNIEQGVHIVCHNRVTIGKEVSITGCCAIVDVTHPYKDVHAGKIGDLIADDDCTVEIGDGAFLGYGAVILPNVRVGKRAVIGANSVVTHDVPDFSVAAGNPAKVIRVYSEKLQQWVKPASAGG
jgi:acetyltransferase-like isoleucine patch superfamily enzyme